MPRHTQVKTGHTDTHDAATLKTERTKRKANLAQQQATTIRVQTVNTDIAAVRVHVNKSNRGQVIASIASQVQIYYRGRTVEEVTVNFHRTFRLERGCVRIFRLSRYSHVPGHRTWALKTRQVKKRDAQKSEQACTIDVTHETR